MFKPILELLGIYLRKPEAEHRLRLVQARAEESIVRLHVENALMFVDQLFEDMTFDKAIETYIRVMAISEPLASTVATRALVQMGRELVPFRKRAQDGFNEQSDLVAQQLSNEWPLDKNSKKNKKDKPKMRIQKRLES